MKTLYSLLALVLIIIGASLTIQGAWQIHAFLGGIVALFWAYVLVEASRRMK